MWHVYTSDPFHPNNYGFSQVLPHCNGCGQIDKGQNGTLPGEAMVDMKHVEDMTCHSRIKVKGCRTGWFDLVGNLDFFFAIGKDPILDSFIQDLGAKGVWSKLGFWNKVDPLHLEQWMHQMHQADVRTWIYYIIIYPDERNAIHIYIYTHAYTKHTHACRTSLNKNVWDSFGHKKRGDNVKLELLRINHANHVNFSELVCFQKVASYFFLHSTPKKEHEMVDTMRWPHLLKEHERTTMENARSLKLYCAISFPFWTSTTCPSTCATLRLWMFQNSA